MNSFESFFMYHLNHFDKLIEYDFNILKISTVKEDYKTFLKSHVQYLLHQLYFLNLYYNIKTKKIFLKPEYSNDILLNLYQKINEASFEVLESAEKLTNIKYINYCNELKENKNLIDMLKKDIDENFKIRFSIKKKITENKEIEFEFEI